MATATRTYTEDAVSSYRSTWTFTVTANDLSVSGASFTIPKPVVTAKYVYANKKYGSANASVCIYRGSSRLDEDSYRYAFPADRSTNYSSWATGVLKTLPFSRLNSQGDIVVQTSDWFNSSNPNEGTINLTYKVMEVGGFSAITQSGSTENSFYFDNWSTGLFSLPSVSIRLNAPPICNSTQVSFVNDYDGDAYAGLTTANVTIRVASAKYGGNIVASSLTIGNQTVTGTGKGTLSILLDTAGTFTPTVTVTDSRGQTTTKTLDAITVKSYTAPQASFTLERTNASGTVDDEGTYAVASATFNWMDAIATLSQPTVSAIDSDGTTLSVSATWYTDRALTTAVNWSSTSSWTSPKTLYGKIGTLPVNESSQITITPNDSEGSGTAQTQTLSTAFYTIDFLAGGHGIAFGQPASASGFECNMPTTFHDTVDCEDTLSAVDIDASGDISCNNLKLALDTTATSGTDKEIYDALVSLGWDSDVIV